MALLVRGAVEADLLLFLREAVHHDNRHVSIAQMTREYLDRVRQSVNFHPIFAPCSHHFAALRAAVCSFAWGKQY